MPTVPPNETIDMAYDLGTLSRPVEAMGSIGDGPDGAADVTWYHFTLDDASRVDITVSTPAGDAPFAGVLSLFNNDPDDFGDPYDLDGHRLMAQVQADPADGVARYTQDLGPGDYDVAISGAGNLDFSPVLAGSGFDGATGSYELTIGADDLGLSGDGPAMLSSDPAPGAVLDSSPLAIRIEMSGSIDPGSIVPGQDVQLFALPADRPAGSPGVPVALASVNFSATADELQIFPLAPLAPGDYVVRLAGYTGIVQDVLTGTDGLALGEAPGHLGGADETFSFCVDGVDGVAGATASDDTTATAHDLGDVVGAGLVQVSGAIGVDPSFDPALSPDPYDLEPQDDPANQVDLYQFQITGPGRYAMLAEVFAGRIGSTLDPGVSLFELDPATGGLVFIAGDNNTLDPAQGTDGSYPLFLDSALSAGLTAGDYYLAVADGSNTPSPTEGQPPGTPGIFDPNVPGSAQDGDSTGPYVLDLLVQPAGAPPQVVASSPAPGQVLHRAPTQVTVQFSEPMDIQQLAFQAFEMSDQAAMPQVFIEGADGSMYYPRFLAYDTATNTATFQMLDGLPNGSYALHLSGPGGLTDLAGDPLVGNGPGGAEVINFVVQGPDSGITGNMTDGYTVQAQVGQGVSQDLGVLFPDELAAGLTINRGPETVTGTGTSVDSSAAEDSYVIQVLQNQVYMFELLGDDLPESPQVTLTNASGGTITPQASFDGQTYFTPLQAGTYTLSVGGWPAAESADISYQLIVQIFGQEDNAPPLVDGPAPAIQIALDGFPAAPGADTPGGSGTGGTAIGGTTNGVTSSGGSTGGGPVGIPSDVPLAVNLVQSEAAVGLASLGISPLGGAGTPDGTAASPTIQVALGVPSSGAAVFDRFAVSLLTMTQVMSTDREGQGTDATDRPPPPAAEAVGSSDQPDSSAPPVAAGGRPDPPALAAAPAGDGPGPESRAVRLTAGESGEPAGDPAAAVEVEVGAIHPVGPVALDGSANGARSFARSDVAAPVGGREETEAGDATWIVRLAGAGAIALAVLGTRAVIRGLSWKRGLANGRRSDRTAGTHPLADDGSKVIRAAGAGTPHAVARRTRREARDAGLTRR